VTQPKFPFAKENIPYRKLMHFFNSEFQFHSKNKQTNMLHIT